MSRNPSTNPLLHVSPGDFQRAMRNIGIKNGTELSSFLGFEKARRGQQLWKDPAGITRQRYETILERVDEVIEKQIPYFTLHSDEIKSAIERIENGTTGGKRLGEESEAVDRWLEFSWTMQTLGIDASTYMKRESDRQALIDRCLCDGFRLLPEHNRVALLQKLDTLLEDLHSEEGTRVRERLHAARISRMRSSELLESIDDESFECDVLMKSQTDQE